MLQVSTFMYVLRTIELTGLVRVHAGSEHFHACSTQYLTNKVCMLSA